MSLPVVPEGRESLRRKAQLRTNSNVRKSLEIVEIFKTKIR